MIPAPPHSDEWSWIHFTKSPLETVWYTVFALTCSHISLLFDDQGIWITDWKKVGGRGKCYIALLMGALIWGLTTKATVHKREQRWKEEDNDSVSPNAHQMFQPVGRTGHIILLTTSQKSGWNINCLSRMKKKKKKKMDFRSSHHSHLWRNAQGSMS